MTSGSAAPDRGLLDTSVFIAREAGRPLGQLPAIAAISVITLAELRLGVLVADRPAIRARRLRTLTAVENAFEPLPIDSEVARTFAELVADAKRQGRRPKIMDTFIAATAIAHSLAVLHAGRGISLRFRKYAFIAFEGLLARAAYGLTEFHDAAYNSGTMTRSLLLALLLLSLGLSGAHAGGVVQRA